WSSNSAASPCEGTPARSSAATACCNAALTFIRRKYTPQGAPQNLPENSESGCARRPELSRRPVRPAAPSDLVELLLEPLRFVMSDQRIDDRGKFSVHDLAELVEGEADAMVAQPVLGEIVGADFFRAVARLDLATPLGPDGLVLLFPFELKQPRPEHAHGLLAVLDLRLFILAGHDHPRGQMRDAHRRVRGVHGLPAGARGTEGVDANVFRLDLNFDLVRFRQNGH